MASESLIFVAQLPSCDGKRLRLRAAEGRLLRGTIAAAKAMLEAELGLPASDLIVARMSGEQPSGSPLEPPTRSFADFGIKNGDTMSVTARSRAPQLVDVHVVHHECAEEYRFAALDPSASRLGDVKTLLHRVSGLAPDAMSLFAERRIGVPIADAARLADVPRSRAHGDINGGGWGAGAAKVVLHLYRSPVAKGAPPAPSLMASAPPGASASPPPSSSGAPLARLSVSIASPTAKPLFSTLRRDTVEAPEVAALQRATHFHLAQRTAAVTSTRTVEPELVSVQPELVQAEFDSVAAGTTAALRRRLAEIESHLLQERRYRVPYPADPH